MNNESQELAPYTPGPWTYTQKIAAGILYYEIRDADGDVIGSMKLLGDAQSAAATPTLLSGAAMLQHATAAFDAGDRVAGWLLLGEATRISRIGGCIAIGADPDEDEEEDEKEGEDTSYAEIAALNDDIRVLRGQLAESRKLVAELDGKLNAVAGLFTLVGQPRAAA